MMYGYVRVCAATPEIKVADCAYNSDNIISCIDGAKGNGADLAVFPELCVTGYTCGDLFNQQALLDAVEKALTRIIAATEDTDMLVFVGVPVHVSGKLYNCAAAIDGGKLLALIPKTFLPEYGEFYETRHFTKAPKGVTDISFAGFTVPFGTDIILKDEEDARFAVAAELCEDLWAPQSPSIRHAMAGADIIVNLSCSDETVGKAEYRRELVRMQSAKLIAGYVYADSGDGESTTDMVFAGHNIICENGETLAESKLFENTILHADLDVEKLSVERQRMSSTFFADTDGYGYRTVGFKSKKKIEKFERTYPRHPFVPESREKLDERTSTILKIQSKGLEKRLLHTHSETAVIGISGGLDSALACLVTCRAFEDVGKDLSNVLCVTMPGFGTTDATLSNSLNLIKVLGCTSRTIPVGETVTKHFADIGHDAALRDVTYENAQARLRTLVLMDLANQTGGIVVGTGDLSELALGWATYNGDHMSMYAVNSSVPKTLVKHLIRYEAERRGGETEKILNAILAQEISPELLPPDENGKISQKTEDIVGPYELHDFFLYYAVRFGFTPDKIRFIAEKTFDGVYAKEDISKWLRVFYKRFFSQQFKRSCIPDGVKVGSVTLSPRADWRMPSDAESGLWLDLID
ncbi:MAG: NAD(+) synthase [Clostridia bacterium]|nr:NAD(+) synthase [Clostridia bacterium]